ncbi:MAG: uracil-DNA glycosylase family protein [Muribaculaceae bacterium]|nr:uracil-DNA glycosylase family protein [Muribaculaceae bacterium]
MKPSLPAIERHPWPPFIPRDPRLLMLGTFPPKPERWSMPFYYPNRINDFWRICGIVFYGNRDYFWNETERRFRQGDIERMLTERHIALWDTGMAVRRLRDNASDKFLEIVEEIELERLLMSHSTIGAVVTTGEKATAVVAGQMGVEVPAIGQPVCAEMAGRSVALWRMPSSSRAYPLSLDKKADAYRVMFDALHIL